MQSEKKIYMLIKNQLIFSYSSRFVMASMFSFIKICPPKNNKIQMVSFCYVDMGHLLDAVYIWIMIYYIKNFQIWF